jgi:MoxR-like ATPase
VEKVIVGKASSIQLALTARLAEVHILLEDVPGVAKTMLARALARSVGCSFKRIQCTPDLLPGEITGISVINPQTSHFEVRPGPVFAQILLADEVNRATPRAQSAFLEAMAEQCVSVDGVDHRLDPPFLVIATQNPIDHEGTFPLPEAQLDRFLIRMSLGYPGMRDEAAMLERIQKQHPIDSLETVATAAELLDAQQAVKEIMVHPLVRDYIVRLVHATRDHPSVRLGASPRASAAIMRAAQARAGLQGFDYVLPDDIKEVAPHILGHRLIIQPESRLRKVTAGEVIRQILHQVEVPVMPEKRV